MPCHPCTLLHSWQLDKITARGHSELKGFFIVAVAGLFIGTVYQCPCQASIPATMIPARGPETNEIHGTCHAMPCHPCTLLHLWQLDKIAAREHSELKVCYI